MRKIIPVVLLLVFSSSIFADGLDDAIKAQCKYDVYGNGRYNRDFDMFLIGWVQSAFYHTPTEEVKTNANPSEIISAACQRALNVTKAGNFYGKISWEVVQIIKGK